MYKSLISNLLHCPMKCNTHGTLHRSLGWLSSLQFSDCSNITTKMRWQGMSENIDETITDSALSKGKRCNRTETFTCMTFIPFFFLPSYVISSKSFTSLSCFLTCKISRHCSSVTLLGIKLYCFYCPHFIIHVI